MQSESSLWVVLARLIRPQGRKGELLAELFTDFPDRLVGRQGLFLVPRDSVADPSTARPVAIISSWLPVGKNRGRVVLQLAGVDTISQAEEIAGLDVVVQDKDRISLEDGSVYVSDLIGCNLFDGADPVGQVTDVQFPSATDGTHLSNAAPLLTVLREDGNEVLVPFVQAFVRSLDLTDRRLVMSLPIGLIDINNLS
ncbi:MAG TPA: ribosome maturation factor RimM [Edaphobacter sp.]|jgi:16S rRNA processing protein RimM